MDRSIFFYTDSRLLGGAEEAMFMLIAGLDRREWRTTLLLEQDPAVQPIAQRAETVGVPVRFVPPTPLGLVGAGRVPRLVRLLLAERPNVFHAHLSWPLAAKFPLLAAVVARVPAIVATVHLAPEFGLKPASYLQLRALSIGIDRYIAVSHDIAATLTDRFHWPRHKVEVIYNAVPVERFEVSTSASLRSSLTGGRQVPIIFTCARLHPQKGHLALLEAAAQLPEAVFVLAGDGPERGALEARASQLGIADRVRFLGVRSDIPQLLAASDVFALPSLYEGTSLSLLEAMAAGRALVSSAIGGTNELIEDGVSGLLVPPGDIDALVMALRRLIADQSLRRLLGSRARERAARDFTPDRMAAGVARVYREVLENGSSAA